MTMKLLQSDFKFFSNPCGYDIFYYDIFYKGKIIGSEIINGVRDDNDKLVEEEINKLIAGKGKLKFLNNIKKIRSMERADKRRMKKNAMTVAILVEESINRYARTYSPNIYAAQGILEEVIQILQKAV